MVRSPYVMDSACAVATVRRMFDSGPPSRRDFLRLGGATTFAVALGASAACAAPPGAQNLSFSVEQIAYGTDRMQMGELNLPLLGTPRPVVVLLHGGYWRTGFDRAAMFELAQDLARIGYASWNLDYRRVGEPGGGWPGTLADVGSGIDKLAEMAPDKQLDLGRVAVIGHSAGAELALWAAGRRKALAGQVGPSPKVSLRAVVALSGVLDMEASARATAEGGQAELRQAVLDLMGGTPEQHPERYAVASPRRLLPIGVPQLVLHGTADDRVPIEQSRGYGAAAREVNERIEVVELSDVDHFDVIKATKSWWTQVTDWLASVMGSPVP